MTGTEVQGIVTLPISIKFDILIGQQRDMNTSLVKKVHVFNLFSQPENYFDVHWIYLPLKHIL